MLFSPDQDKQSRGASPTVEPMKIVHVLRKYNPREWGGIESHLHELSKYLLSEGHQVVLYAPKLRGAARRQDDPLQSLGVTVRRYPAFLPATGVNREGRENLYRQGGNLFSLTLAPRLLAEPNVSVIHSHALNRIGGIARLAAKLKSVPFVVSIHGGYTDLAPEIAASMTARHHGGKDWGKPLGWLVGSRHVVDAAQRVFVFNRVEQQRLAGTLGRKQVTLLPHAARNIDAPRNAEAVLQRDFPQLSGHPYILCVSRIHEAKQQHLLVSAFAGLAAKDPKLKLVLVGSAPDRQYAGQLTHAIEARALTHRVLLTGNLPNHGEQLAALYRKAGVFVLPSRHEPLGIVILEAWAAGLPVVATRTSGALELIQHGETGLLTDQNATAITAAVRRLLSDSALRTRIITQARRYVDTHHSRSAMGKQYLESLQPLIANA
ncbi:MAG TPA: glycosyltransferase family 1 protein [Gammaproteobacteria bacterium]|nr:glycosyltransferase family 1 protein [Gammaproteobacteria bacterium]